MRIIAGNNRGTKLDAVPGMNTRPTADRVKEGLFNVIQMDIEPEAVVLDAFAGTGNLGLEALSRGASRAVFIENDPQAIKVIRANIKKLRLEDRTRVIQGDARSVLSSLAGEKFDLVFLDPPYRKNLYEDVFFSLIKYQLLSKYAILVSEHSKSIPFSPNMDELELYKSKTYGDTVLNFFRLSE